MVSYHRRMIAIGSAMGLVLLTSAVFHLTQTFQKNIRRANYYQQRFDFGRSLPYLQRALALRPSDRVLLERLALAYDRLGQDQKAIKVLEQLILFEPLDLKIALWLVDEYIVARRLESAETLLRRIFIEKNDLEAARKLANVLVWQKKYPQAVALLTQLRRTFPGDVGLLEILADAYVWSGDYAQAILVYEDLLRRQQKPSVVLKLADVLRYEGRDEEAALMYQQYLDGKT